MNTKREATIELDQQGALEVFQGLRPVEPREMLGLWAGRGIPSGHPLDGVLENLGWFGKRFTAELRADALLFLVGDRSLVPIDPAWIPLRLALRFHRFGRTRAARKLFSRLLPLMRARGTVASLKTTELRGVASAAMVYDAQPVVDHFRRLDARRLMGAMTVSDDDRIYFFELERLDDQH